MSNKAMVKLGLWSFSHAQLNAFIEESYQIEGLFTVLREDLDGHIALLQAETPTVDDCNNFIYNIEPMVMIRARPGMNVIIGSHRPPSGGPEIPLKLESLLSEIHLFDAFEFHQKFEWLHPYMDGNGRLGRALWLWKMLRNSIVGAQMTMSRGFLHTYYYQSFDFLRKLGHTFDTPINRDPRQLELLKPPK